MPIAIHLFLQQLRYCEGLVTTLLRKIVIIFLLENRLYAGAG